MFLQFYRLREQPFGVTPNPRYLYHSPAHREALASLIYGIEADLGFAALIAEPGMGKTTLLYYLLERFRSTARTAFVFQTQCDRVELLRYLANELDVPAQEADPVVLNDRLREVLVQEARASRRVIVIIDEAQNLTEDALETVRLLSDFETPDAKLMHIILSGQPELAEKLARPNMAQLLQRIAMLNRLSPFGEADQVSHYLAYRLQVAGYTGPPLFAPDAIELIFTHSAGIPRRINRICFNALSLGCAMQKRRIDAAIVREVLADLDVGKLLSIPGQGGSDRGPSGDDDPVSQGSFRASTDGPSRDKPAREPVKFSASIAGPRAAATRIADPVPLVAQGYVHSQPPCTPGGLALSVLPAVTQGPVRTPQPQPVPVRTRPNSIAAVGRPVAAPSAASRSKSVPETAKPAKAQAVTAAQRPGPRREHRASIRVAVLCALGVPLLILAAWMYMEKQHVSPGVGQQPTMEQSAPLNSGADGDHGTSVTLPPAPEGGSSQKPKKAGPGPRSQALPPAAPGDDEFAVAASGRTPEPDQVRPTGSSGAIVVDFDRSATLNDIDRRRLR